MNPLESRTNYYKELRLKKARERKLKSYRKNKEKYNNQKRQTRCKPEREPSKAALRKRKSRLMKKEKVDKNREYQQRFREKTNAGENRSPLFRNRMEKCRQLKKLKASLPQTPGNRYSIIGSYIASSPACKRKLFPRKDSKDSNIDSAVVENIKGMIKSAKLKRTDDARAAMNILAASVSGNPDHSNSKVAKRLGMRKSRVTGGFKRRTTTFESEKACYTETKRRVRRDRISEETKLLVYDWWISPENSRPTGNKSDIKKKRVGLRLTYRTQYMYLKSHKQKYTVLLKKSTQT